MQQKQPSQSKLKLRPEGVPAATYTPRSRSEQRTRSRRGVKRFSRGRGYTGESNAITSIFKGLLIISLLALALYWVASIPFRIPALKNLAESEPAVDQAAEQAETIATNKNANQQQADENTQADAANTTTAATTAVQDTSVESETQPIAVMPTGSASSENTAALATETSTPNDSAIESDSAVDSNGSVDGNGSVNGNGSVDSSGESDTNLTGDDNADGDGDGDGEIRLEKLDSSNQNSSDQSASSQSENTQIVTTQTQIPEAPADYTISAYKATMFSSLSADATELPVAHGTAVNFIERAGDWVKIEIPDTGKVGYVHITQLSN